jgi:preprotein translocase subunit SecE
MKDNTGKGCVEWLKQIKIKVDKSLVRQYNFNLKYIKGTNREFYKIIIPS